MIDAFILSLAAALFEGIFIYRLLTDAEFRAQWVRAQKEDK